MFSLIDFIASKPDLAKTVFIPKALIYSFNAFITDFGLSKMFSPTMLPTNMYGTSGYRAPEMEIPNPMITPKCDVYSFGVRFLIVIIFSCNSKGNPPQIDFKQGSWGKRKTHFDFVQKAWFSLMQW